MFLTAVIAISERGEERGKLDLVVAGEIGGELRLELAGGNHYHCYLLLATIRVLNRILSS